MHCPEGGPNKSVDFVHWSSGETVEQFFLVSRVTSRESMADSSLELPQKERQHERSRHQDHTSPGEGSVFRSLDIFSAGVVLYSDGSALEASPGLAGSDEPHRDS